MSTRFISEIRLMSFGFAPQGWAQCNGQLLPINQNQALFSLLGTTYGGNGQTNFALPDLRGRVPIHEGQGHTLGERAGQEFHTLILSEMPAHIHTAQASTNTGNVQNGAGNVLGAVPGRIYADPGNLAPLHPSTVTNVGGSQPHENRQPLLTLNYCIALTGIFPSQN